MNLATFLSRRYYLGIALAVVVGGVALHAQRPSGGGGTALMIDFNAVTADGKPVAELSPADVTIRIGGKQRTITSLTLKTVGGGGGGAAESSAPESDSASPPFATNEPKASGGAGRAFILVIDTDSLRGGTEPPVREAIEGLLKQLNSSDRVAFSIAPRDAVALGFGAGLAKVRAAVAAFRAERPASVSTAENLCRTRDSLNVLNGLLEPLAGSETPTSVVFIAASLSLPGEASSTTAGSCSVTSDQYQAIVQSAAAGRANLYVVQADASALGRNDGLDNLAGVTGAGTIMRVVNEGFAPRVLADASSYWVATLAPDPADRPGQTQRLDVRTTREGVAVRVRPETAVPRAGAPGRPAAGGGSGGGGGAKTPKEMVATAAPFTDLQLRAMAYSTRGAADKMNVFVFAEPVDPTAKITAMMIGFFDQTGKGGSIPAPNIATSPIAAVLPLGVGEYRIRLAATDASGKSGAVDVNINTALTPAGPLNMSGLLLGAPNDKGALVPRLRFSTEDKIMATLDLIGNFAALTGNLSAKFELARTDVGPAIKTYQPSSAGPTSEPDKFQVNGEIPLGNLEPGDYVIRVIVQVAGQPEGRIMRTFRKVAK